MRYCFYTACTCDTSQNGHRLPALAPPWQLADCPDGRLTPLTALPSCRPRPTQRKQHCAVRTNLDARHALRGRVRDDLHGKAASTSEGAANLTGWGPHSCSGTTAAKVSAGSVPFLRLLPLAPRLSALLRLCSNCLQSAVTRCRCRLCSVFPFHNRLCAAPLWRAWYVAPLAHLSVLRSYAPPWCSLSRRQPLLVDARGLCVWPSKPAQKASSRSAARCRHPYMCRHARATAATFPTPPGPPSAPPDSNGAGKTVTMDFGLCAGQGWAGRAQGPWSCAAHVTGLGAASAGDARGDRAV